jgi:rhamnulokinase
MPKGYSFLAMDFGAESGRGVVVTLRDDKVSMEEIHRFPNRPVRLGGTLYWDYPFLYAQILTTLRLCAERSISPAGIGVDTWGVDFGLLGSDGQLLGNPVHYRDARTEGIHDYSNPILSTDEIFAATAYDPWPISSLFQLLAMKRSGSPILPLARTFLNMPDLFNYHLTGVAVSERSIASNSNLMGADGEWCRGIIDRFELPEMFAELVPPGTLLGPLQSSDRNEAGLGEIPVIATCGHDTAAVAAAVPAYGKHWAFLSSGTWSILGTLRDTPITALECHRQGFSNEYTLGGWFLCRNILGLWLVQELRRKWNTATDPWDYHRMMEEATRAKSGPLIDVADGALLAPPDMEAALIDLLRRLAQPQPESRAELVRCVLESLALEYARCLEVLSKLVGEKSEALFMVGGGIANRLLCQLTADACGIPVHAGVDQCTALGNALTQAVALNLLGGPADIRQVMRNSFEMITYEPRNSSFWTERLHAYKNLPR